jgi:hypothetical protein
MAPFFLLGPLLVGCVDAQPVHDDNIDALARLTAVPETRIGSADNPEVGFSQLATVDVDSDGNVYALEAMDPEIRVHDSSGRLIRRIGAPGEGPGEFQGAPWFGVHGDTVWAFDLGARRITLFDRTGKVLSTARTEGLRIPLPGRYGYVYPFRMRSDGTFAGWLSTVGSSPGDAPPPVDRDERVPIPHVRFSAAGEVIDTLGWMPGPPPRVQLPPGYGADRFRMITIGSRRYPVPDPPTELPTWLSLDDGYIVVDVPYATASNVGAFTVTRIGLAGDTIYHREFAYQPSSYAVEELDSAAARGARGLGNAPVPEAERRVAQNALRSELRFPALKLPIRHPWLAQDGGVWLLRDDLPGGPARWIVLGVDGHPRGQLQLAPDTRPLWSRGDLMWAAEYDDTGVPWLVRYRIER